MLVDQVKWAPDSDQVRVGLPLKSLRFSSDEGEDPAGCFVCRRCDRRRVG